MGNLQTEFNVKLLLSGIFIIEVTFLQTFFVLNFKEDFKNSYYTNIGFLFINYSFACKYTGKKQPVLNIKCQRRCAYFMMLK